MRHRLLLSLLFLVSSSLAQSACVRKSSAPERVKVALEPWTMHQVIDGFGTTGPYAKGTLPAVPALLYDDLGASILRVDLTPAFKPPVSDYHYNSPWFHAAPSLPGPEGNNVRTYRDVRDYGRKWSGRHAAIAVMGPDIERNVKQLAFDTESIQSFGTLAREGARRVKDFKLVGSLWSPAPWLKRAHGSRIGKGDGIVPREGTPWPFIWGGNFAGGVLDTSGTPRAAFDDKKQGGTGPTSALTQFARTFAAYLLGFQRTFGVRFYAVSLQNELNFETFYNSCSYPDAADYLKIVKAVRRELDAHEALRDIRIMGPEDLLGSDAFGMWQFGGGSDVTHKNLRYLAALANDPEALRALSFFAIHGYAPDGVKSAGADPETWRWWVRGWETKPAEGLPNKVRGFTAFGKKSWMTETSGEPSRWIASEPGGLDASALGIALKIHQALTVGQESAWLYWQVLDDNPVSQNTLTDLTLGARGPKFVAAKHYFRHIRPGARRIGVRVEKSGEIHAAAFAHGAERTLTVVLVHTGKKPVSVSFTGAPRDHVLESYQSDARTQWKRSEPAPAHGGTVVRLPAESVTTVVVKPPP